MGLNDMPKGHRAGNIDAHLRRAFREMESDPLPERLLGLLEELRRSETGGAPDGAGPQGATEGQEPDRG